ncbi:pectate lyase family protein [Paenibacillus massiliensis]|uniref:pectate lyase family protein n=1 Tax=Paenibacillus massiliensis TaxID=225917 RepID=UPI0004011071|nr:pectate lyase [Paenibacillus massiliensis]
MKVSSRMQCIGKVSICMLLLWSWIMVAGAGQAGAEPVFPGAVGFGTDTPAGRGGKVIKVTNLNNEGPGSFREALAAKGPRIIVFEVGGIIDLEKERLDLREPYVTIAGQTAPSPGITFIRGGMQIRTHDVLMQHVRFRMGDAESAPGSGFEPDVSTYGASAYNIVIDHCSFSWGVDENMSFSGPRTNGPEATTRRVTLSNNIIAEGLNHSVHEKGSHSMGTLVHDYVQDVAVIGNLYAHNMERNPWFKGFATGVIVNNVIYNPGKWAIRLGYVEKEWANTGITPEGPRVSIVGNYLRHGADTVQGLGLVGTNSKSGSAYLEDNLAYDQKDKPAPLTFGGIVELSNPPVWIQGLKAVPASAVLKEVTTRAGARPKDRDATDQRIISDVLAGRGELIDSQEDVGGYPDSNPTYRTLHVPEQGMDEWLYQFSRELE